MTDRSSRDELAGQDADLAADHHRYDDEISLYDLFDVLVRRWSVIAGVFVAVLGLGAAMAFSSTPEYTFRSSLQLAQVYTDDGFQLIETSDEARARLADGIIPDIRRPLLEQGQGAPRVSVEQASASSRLRLTSVAPESARSEIEALHTAIAEALAAEQAERFEANYQITLQRPQLQLAQLRDEAAAIQQQFELIAQRQQEVAGAEVTLVALIDNQRVADLRRELSNVRNRMARVQAEIEAIERLSRQSRLNFVATQSEERAGTGRSLMLALAGVLGVMAGVFGAFVWEFVVNARRRRTA